MTNHPLADELSRVLPDLHFRVVDRADHKPREAVLAPPPSAFHPRLRAILAERLPDGMYLHQVRALDAVLDGQDVGLSTSTASGKSLVFMSAAAHRLLGDPSQRVLALYPAKALIQDQVAKWNDLLEPLGLRAGIIDGSVPGSQREEILGSCQVLLMTPDVVHSWMMSRLSSPVVRSFLGHLSLLILDEAHAYEGVFGTNSAYLFRRLAAVAGKMQVICSTATVEKPELFLKRLTGRDFRCFTQADETCNTPPKSTLLLRCELDKPFEATVSLLAALARRKNGRFLTFGDSRKVVESLVSSLHRASKDDDEEGEDDDGPVDVMAHLSQRVLPYRAGYEVEDRQAIQAALKRGQLSGVVSTSALELGLDIGEIDVVVMLGVPPSMKSFWQRLGRAGRRNPGVCLLIDDRRILASEDGVDELAGYLARPIEPSYLYFDNRYLQFAQALCAAHEIREAGLPPEQDGRYADLPQEFRVMLEGELSPGDVLPADLYCLKQRGQGGPHREFPLRSGIEQSFKVIGPHQQNLGSLSMPQMMREAYPGAIHYYMARPYRVISLNLRKGEVIVRPDKRYSTRPTSQVTVFPKFEGGLLMLLKDTNSFVAEVEMQVSERVTGFVETRGQTKESVDYGPGSLWSQQPLCRFFSTTGVCWVLPSGVAATNSIASAMLEACSVVFGIQASDLGVGRFHAKESPLGSGAIDGVCIFDATNGSLRLTQRLAENFSTVARRAAELVRAREGVSDLEPELEEMAEVVDGLSPHGTGSRPTPVKDEDGWLEVIENGEMGMLISSAGTQEVRVTGFRYTPNGAVYDLEPVQAGVRWWRSVADVQPLNGVTKTRRVNVVTGEGM